MMLLFVCNLNIIRILKEFKKLMPGISLFMFSASLGVREATSSPAAKEAIENLCS